MNKINVTASVWPGHYNWLDTSEVEWKAVVRFCDCTISAILLDEPEFNLPSELVDAIEIQLKRMWVTNKQETFDKIADFRKNQNEYDALYCDEKYNDHMNEARMWSDTAKALRE